MIYDFFLVFKDEDFQNFFKADPVMVMSAMTTADILNSQNCLKSNSKLGVKHNCYGTNYKNNGIINRVTGHKKQPTDKKGNCSLLITRNMGISEKIIQNDFGLKGLEPTTQTLSNQELEHKA